MNIELLLSALVAAGLVFWLRSILGTRHGDERERPNPFTPVASDSKTPALPEAEAFDHALPHIQEDRHAELPRNVTVVSDQVRAGLDDIARADGSFALPKFALAAQDAFAMIVEAFAAADRDSLKEFLAPSVYEAFDGAIKEREQRGETMTNQIHTVSRSEILEASVDGKTAYVTLRFVAQESCVIRDAQGNILSGHPDRVTEMNDIWTFSRVLRSADPKWLLHATRDGDVKEDHKTPIPDSV